MKLVFAIVKSIKEFLASSTTNAMNVLDSLLRLPSLLLGGAPRMPSTPPAFEPAVDPRELVAELSNGHGSPSKASPALDPVALVVKFSRLPKDERIQIDLSPLDITTRARLLSLKDAELRELSRSSRSAIERFLKPLESSAGLEVKTRDVILPTPAELRRRIKMFMEGKEDPSPTPTTPRAL